MGLTRAAALRWAGDLIFPRPCPGCDAPLATGHPGEFCEACTAELPWLRPPFCGICGDAFRVAASADADRFADRLCARCRDDRPAFAVARAAFIYAGPVRKAVHRLKFDGWRSLAPGLAAMITASVGGDRGILVGVDLILPVPLHGGRQRERGFNQAEQLGKGIAAFLGRPMAPGALIRTRATLSQVGLDRADRLENLREAFACPEPVRVADRTILLVDDVLTTGATAHACARILRKAGAREIRVAALARD